MNCKQYSVVFLLLAGLSIPVGAVAQSDSNDISLGDLARSYRKSQAPPARTLIDNDNLLQVMDEVQARKLAGGLLFSFDGLGKSFQVSSPDGTCSLSFSAQATSLVSAPFAARDLPDSELGKLEGPAIIDGNRLQVSVHNGSAWDLREITVALTILRPPDLTTMDINPAKLAPAEGVSIASAEKRPDVTVLYHLKAAAAPLTTTVFQGTLDTALGTEQEWHWAIVQARGIAPAPPAPPVSPAQGMVNGEERRINSLLTTGH
jgi:hypothetical protein